MGGMAEFGNGKEGNADASWDGIAAQNFGSDIRASQADTSREACCGFCLFIFACAKFSRIVAVYPEAAGTMIIIAIAWLYVVFMMSITEQSAVAGVTTFLLYGVFPLSIVLYLMATPQRKRNRQKQKNSEKPRQQAMRGDNTVQDESAAPPPPEAGQ